VTNFDGRGVGVKKRGRPWGTGGEVVGGKKRGVNR